MRVYTRANDEAVHHYVTLQAYYRLYNGREHRSSPAFAKTLKLSNVQTR